MSFCRADSPPLLNSGIFSTFVPDWTNLSWTQDTCSRFQLRFLLLLVCFLFPQEKCFSPRLNRREPRSQQSPPQRSASNSPCQGHGAALQLSRQVLPLLVPACCYGGYYHYYIPKTSLLSPANSVNTHVLTRPMHHFSSSFHRNPLPGQFNPDWVSLLSWLWNRFCSAKDQQCGKLISGIPSNNKL